MSELSGAERQELRSALLSAIHREGDMRLVVDVLDTKYDHIVSGQTYLQRVLSLIEWAESNGLIRSLLNAARDFNDGNARLAAFYERYVAERPVAGTPAANVPAVPEALPEALPFRDQDERVSITWMRRGLAAAESVARLTVPRVIHGQPDGGRAYGTGWLISPDLILTNHHVIEARDLRSGPVAARGDFEAQARATIVEFGHFSPDLGRLVGPVSLVADNRALDYALLRVTGGPPGMAPLEIAPASAPAQPGVRVNVLQHAQGHPLKFAIRNNFVVPLPGTYQGPPVVRYLTETEGGASGSPVLDDRWQVVALHRAAVPTAADAAKSQQNPLARLLVGIARYHNEGIRLDAILDDLPPAIRAEIPQPRAR